MCINTCSEDTKVVEPGCFLWCPVKERRPHAQTETQEIPSEQQGTLWSSEGDQALAQVAKRGCGALLTGDAWKPSGHGPAQLALLE